MMMKEHKKTFIITSIVTVLPVLVGLIFWNRLPDEMATNFSFQNEANGFSSKPFAVFGLPLFCLAMLWISGFATLQDPKKQNISPKIFSIVLWIVAAVSLISSTVIYTYNLGLRVDFTFFMELMPGLLFIIIGSCLPKARQNYTIGIKTPWTLANEENWKRTHRLAGFLWRSGGVLISIAVLTRMDSGKLFLAILIIMALVPYGYSCYLHAKENL